MLKTNGLRSRVPGWQFFCWLQVKQLFHAGVIWQITGTAAAWERAISVAFATVGARLKPAQPLQRDSHARNSGKRINSTSLSAPQAGYVRKHRVPQTL
ncbi:MAG: hypothetical protein BGO21_02600 [Dyadobacter sp. 50-39]|nr:MAG: hypothetical protein BGO21_02600 [Dyadobacter sp. 50-39]